MPDNPKDENRNGKKTIKDAQIGVMGNHARIDGGIHFNYYSNGPSKPDLSDAPAPEQPQHETVQPRVDEKRPKVFISYARENQAQAKRLYNDLENAGAIPWLDVEDLLPGQKWRPAIRQAIKASDYVIVMISAHSVSKRGFVQAELKKALEVLEEFPADGIFLIPVRLEECMVTDEALLELNIVDLFPDWERGLAKILKVILPSDPQEPAGRPQPAEPQPYTVPADLLKFLPGGAVDVESRFYIARQADAHVLTGVRRHRGLVTLQGPRQTGKTSMLLRLYVNARRPESPFRPVLVDFQSLARRKFERLTTIWQAILKEVDTQLDIGALDDEAWLPKASYDRNVTGFLERFVFSYDDTPVLICLDEVDRVFSTSVQSDFFASVRAFFNRGAYDPAWKKIRWLLSTSSEPRFFIDDLNQSPFNVGSRVMLGAFTIAEISAFVRHYGFSPEDDRTRRIMAYTGGRPYLVHLLLHHMALEPGRESALFDAASAGDGVFKPHLDHYLTGFQAQPDLVAAMKQVLAGRGCADVRQADRLAAAGLVKEDAKGCWICACELYAVYLGGKL